MPKAGTVYWDGKMWVGECGSLASGHPISAKFMRREGAESFIACGVDTSKYRPTEQTLPSLLPGIGSTLSLFYGNRASFTLAFCDEDTPLPAELTFPRSRTPRGDKKHTPSGQERMAVIKVPKAHSLSPPPDIYYGEPRRIPFMNDLGAISVMTIAERGGMVA